eukprot:TRINITY_DN65324_c0_g1_i1.p3 TRINITY_DN65324_c0_g1~~TRINITY_DN65324_c0_g1_i1.p3  ORF type:complete len:160 (+),score=25.28 TRINITY_DN65324_c0_g1_i1:168-647(+)
MALNSFCEQVAKENKWTMRWRREQRQREQQQAELRASAAAASAAPAAANSAAVAGSAALVDRRLPGPPGSTWPLERAGLDLLSSVPRSGSGSVRSRSSSSSLSLLGAAARPAMSASGSASALVGRGTAGRVAAAQSVPRWQASRPWMPTGRMQRSSGDM